MQLKSVLSCLVAVLFGAAFGIAVYIAFAHHALPATTSGPYAPLLTPPVPAAQAAPGHEARFLDMALEVFPLSFALGTLAGLLARRLAYPRVFCGAALPLPAIHVLAWCITMQRPVPNSYEELAMLAEMESALFGLTRVYGSYFLALGLTCMLLGRRRRERLRRW